MTIVSSVGGGTRVLLLGCGCRTSLARRFAARICSGRRTMATDTSNEVLFEVRDVGSIQAQKPMLSMTWKRAGVVTLNRPKALNALTTDMLKRMFPKLKEWEKSSEIDLVIMEGAGGKAFCAGGDIKSITESKGDPHQLDFFRHEYRTDHLTGTIKKPYVAIIDGIVMGGGVGLSVHGQYRVATEKTMFAMPETGIGLVTDVGGGFFLPRMSSPIDPTSIGNLGMFMALTGHRLKGEDCLHSGIATHGCKSELLPKLKDDLVNIESPSDIPSVLESYSKDFPTSAFSLEEHRPEIERCFGMDTVEEIVACLQEGNDWAKKMASNMLRMSPTSLKVTHRLVREGAEVTSLADDLRMEFRLVARCCEDPDFYEGVRALLVDRDNAPKWSPPTLEEVTDAHVDHYFSRLADEDEELKL